MTHALLRALVSRGHAADVVLSAADGDPYEVDGVRVWPRTGKADPFRFVDDSDVIVAHVESASRPLALGDIRGIPVVQIAHNAGAFTESALRKRPAALTVFNSGHVADRLGELCVRSIVVRPPVQLNDYRTTPGDAVTLVNLSEDKGAEVFYALAERFPGRQFLGVRGGYGVQITPHGPDDLPNVDIVDHVAPHLMRDQVYARTRVLLMPSAHESWGRVGAEAMCSGIPVIAHPTPGLRESLGAAGTFCDREDVDAWAVALRKLLDGRSWRPASRKALARAAELDPAADLDRWCSEVEALARRRLRVRARVPS
ncbi:glycosyltransferase family 4 protein [Spirillospora sp. NPDC048911]|uniref:glycosyltransferase family 4 protein n=1 Tax=Spirillospora sp. NPDC048911 TaxID=3364527 RepID=UPI00370FE2D3